jgi:hypothetical protein
MATLYYKVLSQSEPTTTATTGVPMTTFKRTIAAAELLLVFPAALFMSALLLRNLQPPQYEPAHTALRLVEWFSARPFLALDIGLIAMPVVAVVIGCTTVLRGWRDDAELRQAALATLAAGRAHLATLLIAGATLGAGAILAIVALHVITD